MEALQSSPYRVTKRQALQVNVRNACSDILDYVHARIRDDRGKRARFSLYLSAHLMYGVTSIWRKQVQILLTDAQEIKSRVGLEIAAIESINLRTTARLDQITLPDVVSKEAGNPFFGSLKYFDDDWQDALQAKLYLELASPVASLSPPTDRGMQFDDQETFKPDHGSPHTVSSKDEITMKELPFSLSPMMDVPIPGEMDIPTLDGAELDMMTSRPEEEVVLTLQDLLPDAAVTGLGSPSAMAIPDRGEHTPEKATKKVDGRAKGEKKRRKRQADDLDRSQTEQPSAPKRPSPQDISLELLPIAIEVSPRQRRLHRELFVDVNKEMSKDAIRHNLSTAHTTCRQFVLPTPSPSTPAELLKAPGSKHLAKNPLLKRLWRRNCKESLLETDSDMETPIWSVPELVRGGRGLRRVRRLDSSAEELSYSEEEKPLEATFDQQLDVPLDIEQVERGTPSMEVVREGSLSQSRTPQHSSLHLPLDQSAPEASLSASRRSRQEMQAEDKRASGVEGSISSLEEPLLLPEATAHGLEVLPEEVEEMVLSPSYLPDHPPGKLFSPERRFIRRCEVEGSGQCTTFRAVCPITMPRPQAAKCFITLLGECAGRRLYVRQHRPYGDIYISTSKRHLPRTSS